MAAQETLQIKQPFYELKLWVSEESGLRETYADAVMKHNKLSIPCIYENQMEEFDAGFDLFCPEDTQVKGRTTVKMNHMVKCAMNILPADNFGGGKPVGYYLYPRSSTGSKTPLRMANSVGIIDSGYRGNIIAVFDNWLDDDYTVQASSRVVQLCPPNLTHPIVVRIVNEESELGVTTRGNDGFGSTGI